MFKRRYQAAIIIAIILPLSLIEFSPLGNEPMPTKATARFEIAAWTYPDAYGQGIDHFYIYENSTGAWVFAYECNHDDDSNDFEWNTNVGIKLRVFTLFNSTLTGASSFADGKRFLRHSVTVITFGQFVWSQSNFTYYHAAYYDDPAVYSPIWMYQYDVTLNFLPSAGQYYLVTVTYEVFYGVG